MGLLEWTVAAGVVLSLGALLPRLVERSLRTGETERPVLPAHYSSIVQTDPSRYPGHCPACGTDNEPGYRYCEDCGSEIPSSDDFGGTRDLGAILGE